MAIISGRQRRSIGFDITAISTKGTLAGTVVVCLTLWALLASMVG